MPAIRQERMPAGSWVYWLQIGRAPFHLWQCRLVDFLTHSSHCFPRVSFFALGTSPFQCLYACVPAGRREGRQTGGQVNGQAGKSACHSARKNACQFANLKAYWQAAMLFSLAWQHLALSWQLVAFLTRISALQNALPLHPSGRAKPKACTTGPGPSFFWAAERYRATDTL